MASVKPPTLQMSRRAKSVRCRSMYGRNCHLLLNSSPTANGTAVSLRSASYAAAAGCRRKARHDIALLAAQQLVHGHAQGLARDVVQRDVNRALRGQQHAPTLEILAAIQLLPEAPALHRVFADQKLAEVFERA